MITNNKESWELFIDTLKKKESLLQVGTETTKEAIISNLASLLEKTIIEKAQLASQQGKIGILFSGGVDSTLICWILQQHNIPFVAITIGFQDNEDQKLPDDIFTARTIVKALDFNQYEKIYRFDDMEELFKETVAVLGLKLANAVNVGVGSVEVAGIKELILKDSKIKHIFGGLGSEEIFAGYKRHADAKDKHKECWKGLHAMFTRDLLRDFAIADAYNITFWTPFLDEKLISFAMNIPVDFKIDDNGSKLILREAAIKLKLPKEYALRPKKAAQYGSRTDHALGKLAKKNGFQYKKDYIQSLL